MDCRGSTVQMPQITLFKIQDWTSLNNFFLLSHLQDGLKYGHRNFRNQGTLIRLLSFSLRCAYMSNPCVNMRKIISLIYIPYDKKKNAPRRSQYLLKTIICQSEFFMGSLINRFAMKTHLSGMLNLLFYDTL